MREILKQLQLPLENSAILSTNFHNSFCPSHADPPFSSLPSTGVSVSGSSNLPGSGPVARSSVQYSMRFVSDSRATIGTFSQEDLQRALQSVATTSQGAAVSCMLIFENYFVALFNYRHLNHFPHHPDTLIDQVDTNDTKLRSVCIESSNNIIYFNNS